ncbi:MAG: excisionase family DNA-binding protein [Prevotella sp.]
MNKQVLSTMKVLAEAQAMFESEKVGSMLKKIDRFEQFLLKFDGLENLINSYQHLEKLLYTTKEFLCVDEAACYLGFSKSRMYKMAERREVPSYKPNGKNVFFAREDLNNWIRTARVSSVEEIERQAEIAANAYMLNRKSN